jgi:hypothetical protein
VIGASSSRMAMVMERPVALSFFCKSYAGVFLRRHYWPALPTNRALAVVSRIKPHGSMVISLPWSLELRIGDIRKVRMGLTHYFRS